MGLSIDWSREIATCDPDYYRHEQAMFVDFMAAGLVERRPPPVNWDSVDRTVLANEQVIEGRGWRSGALVEKRELAQWFLKITDYSRELLDALDGLTGWPEKVRLMQRNWIGRSEGLRLSFDLVDSEGRPLRQARRLHHPPRHHFRRHLLRPLGRPPADPPAGRASPEVAQFRRECAPSAPARKRSSAPRRRLPLALFAVHPFRPGLLLPVYAANFVLMGYGEGAIFGCPAHDQRDLDFARVWPSGHTGGRHAGSDPASAEIGDTAFLDAEGADTVMINSDFLNGMAVPQAKEAIAARAEAMGIGALGELPPARLGRVAPTLLGLPDSGDPRPRCGAYASPRRTCPSPCRRTSLSTSRATRSTVIRRGST